MLRAFSRAGAVALLCLLLPQSASAANFFWGKNGRRKWSIAFETGARYFMHYNRLDTMTTPPDAILGEVQLTYFRNKTAGLTFHYAHSVMGASASTYGLGGRLSFLTLPNRSRSVFSGISLQLLLDLSHYQLAPPDANHVYQASGFIFRYGAGIIWGLGRRSGFEVETSMTATRLSGNFFIGPFLGLGYNF